MPPSRDRRTGPAEQHFYTQIHPQPLYQHHAAGAGHRPLQVSIGNVWENQHGTPRSPQYRYTSKCQFINDNLLVLLFSLVPTLPMSWNNSFAWCTPTNAATLSIRPPQSTRFSLLGPKRLAHSILSTLFKFRMAFVLLYSKCIIFSSSWATQQSPDLSALTQLATWPTPLSNCCNTSSSILFLNPLQTVNNSFPSTSVKLKICF